MRQLHKFRIYKYTLVNLNIDTMRDRNQVMDTSLEYCYAKFIKVTFYYKDRICLRFDV
jgi:hypothetical protein